MNKHRIIKPVQRPNYFRIKRIKHESESHNVRRDGITERRPGDLENECPDDDDCQKQPLGHGDVRAVIGGVLRESAAVPARGAGDDAGPIVQ
jgi:hypothetical protein